jgi:hypothetical protein
MARLPAPRRPDATVDLDPVVEVVDSMINDRQGTVNQELSPLRGVTVFWYYTGDADQPFWLRVNGPDHVIDPLLSLYRNAGYTEEVAWTGFDTMGGGYGMFIRPSRQ